MWSCALKVHQHLRTIQRLDSRHGDGEQCSKRSPGEGAATGYWRSAAGGGDGDGTKEEVLPSLTLESESGDKVVVKRQRAEEMDNDTDMRAPSSHRVSHADDIRARKRPHVAGSREVNDGRHNDDGDGEDVVVVVEDEDEDEDEKDNNNSAGTDHGVGDVGATSSLHDAVGHEDVVFVEDAVTGNPSDDVGEACRVATPPDSNATALFSATQAPLLNSQAPIRESSTCGAPSPSPPFLLFGLSEEQQCVFDLVVNAGRSVFLTGGAGTGKSHLLRAIIAALPRNSTFVTATTGMAALNLGGATLHSFAGCGLIDQQHHTPTSVYHAVQRKTRAKRNWRNCRVLVVDEVSMMDAWLLDVLEYVARKIRGSCDPFGGIQVVFSGDFLQLPPVTKSGRRESRFCFEAASWCRINPRVCVLSQRFRQREEVFFSMLNEMRHGVLTATSLTLLSSLSTVTTVRFVNDTIKAEEDGVKENNPDFPSHNACSVVDSRGRSEPQRYAGFTILRARRAEVEAVNMKRFNELTTEIISYKGYHSGEGSYPSDLPSVVSLRVGCRVMLLKNLDVSIGLVNGSIGTLVKFINARKVNDFANKTTPGDLRHLADHALLPVVRFDAYNKGRGDEPNTTAGRLVMIEPHRWTVNQGDREVSCSIQIPLQLAYAITIHKSQGMSLSHVNVDFKGIFEEGQAYVALSRCTDMNNLAIENFDAQRVSPNARALAYYKSLEEAAAERNEDEIERRLLQSGIKSHPWGPYDADGADDGNEENNNHGSNIIEKRDGSVEEVKSNAAVIVEGIRLRLTPVYVFWSALRTRVLSAAERAASVHGALLVMDVTSLLALTSLANSVEIYEEVFLTHQNMLRIPRSVKEELLRTASRCETEMCRSSTEHLSLNSASSSASPAGAAASASTSATAVVYDATEVAWATLCIMEDAKKDFVLDEQRDGESRQLPAILPEWEMFAPLLLPLQQQKDTSHHATDAQTLTPNSLKGPCGRDAAFAAQHLSLLEFSCYLREQYSANRAVFVCTESIQLAACALAVGLGVCSIAYLCPRDPS